jgi:anti-sigma regulatory factor (Ser/Thr protein kinase)
MTKADCTEFNLPVDLAGLQALSEGVDRFAERLLWPSSTAFAVQLCLEESISNVIRHGGLAAGETVRVALRQDADGIVIEITDRGAPFDPLGAAEPPPQLSLETATVGGRGIALMRKFCPDMTYRRTGDTNQLRLAFPPPPDHP